MNAAPGPAPWRGILPSLPTFFDADGAVDAAAFLATARFAVDNGAAGLVCFGLAGEVGRLTTAEREQLLEALLAAVPRELPVLTGVTAENLRESQRLARHAEDAGAVGVIIPPPTAYRLGDEDLVDFIAGVAGVVELPAIVQDAPEYLGVRVGPELVLRAAAQAGSISGLKAETGAEGMEAWRAALGDGFAVYGGNGGLFLLECLRAGADGMMPGVDTIDLQVAIERAEREGRHDEAQEAFERLLPLLVFELQSIDHYNACAKHVLRRRGLDVPQGLRAPGPQGLSDASTQRLDRYLERLDLASPAARA